MLRTSLVGVVSSLTVKRPECLSLEAEGRAKVVGKVLLGPWRAWEQAALEKEEGGPWSRLPFGLGGGGGA